MNRVRAPVVHYYSMVEVSLVPRHLLRGEGTSPGNKAMGKIQYNGLQCKIDIACLPIKHELDILILWCHCKNVG